MGKLRYYRRVQDGVRPISALAPWHSKVVFGNHFFLEGLEYDNSTLYSASKDELRRFTKDLKLKIPWEDRAASSAAFST